MTTVGIYDSGIGGLTTLCLLQRCIPNANFYYLADNLNMPFGTKTNDEIEEIVYRGIKKLEAHSDVTVLACNTASATTTATNVIKLLPNSDDILKDKTLILATPLTLSHLFSAKTHILTASTPELASKVEIQASLCFKFNQMLNMAGLHSYLKDKLAAVFDIENIVLGCSHYAYLKAELTKLFGFVNFFDGNQSLINEVEKAVETSTKPSKLQFDFTGADDTKKYEYIINNLKDTYI
ncbi:MAG: hypothetical protein RSB59_01945 [Clostridia bacterium]